MKISLLRSLPIFHGLHGPALEGVAHSLKRVDYESGAAIMREGDQGDRFYAITDAPWRSSEADKPLP